MIRKAVVRDALRVAMHWHQMEVNAALSFHAVIRRETYPLSLSLSSRSSFIHLLIHRNQELPL